MHHQFLPPGASQAYGEGMDHRTEVSEFLRSRRNRITPEQAGIVGGGRPRVPGLRREEVAMLAGVSVEYYARMQRGELAGVSAEVLDSVAQALQLDEAEIDHLADLSRAAGPGPIRRPRRACDRGPSPTLQRFLDAVTGAPVWVRDRRMDFVAANPLGRALYSPLFEDSTGRANTARFTFLDPAARSFFPDWERNADDIVATLRIYAGQNPRDKGLTDVIGELAARSDDFSRRWSARNVRHHRAGRKRIHHPVVGDLELSYEALDLPANPEWFLFAYTAEPGSPSEERLALLGSLAATDQEAAAAPEDHTGR